MTSATLNPPGTIEHSESNPDPKGRVEHSE